MVLFSLICLVSIIIDQVTKFFAARNLYGESIDIIENVFSFTYLENRGAAWGIFSENSWVLLILIPILIFIIGLYLIKVSNTRIELACGGLIVGGAVGNYIDRLFKGYVVDFLDFKVWPVFNFADVFIVVGCILFIIVSMRGEFKKK